MSVVRLHSSSQVKPDSDETIPILPGLSAPHGQARLSFQAENFRSFMGELPPLLYEHWLEVALDRDKIKLDPDFEKYVTIDDAGMLSSQTMRDNGKLVGYFISIVVPHLHYRQSLTASTDVYYIDPAHRRGLSSYRFLKFVERDLKRRGVQKHYTMRKLHLDPRIGDLWERLGYKPVELWYTKILED